jgi:hypothetical protein
MAAQLARMRYLTILMLTASEAAMSLVAAHIYLFFAAALLGLLFLLLMKWDRGVSPIYAATFLIFISFAKGTLLTETLDVLLILPAFLTYNFLWRENVAQERVTVADSGEHAVVKTVALRLAFLCLLAVAAVFLADLFSSQLDVGVTSILILIPVIGLGLLVIVIAGHLTVHEE